MVTSDLGACEWFVWDLRRSGLVERGQLDQVIGEFLRKNPRAEPPALAEYLVNQDVLSPFQAERILGGKTQGLVLGPYVLMDVLGSGSMGQVYRAQSKTDNQWYAIKVLPRRSMWNVRLARRQVRSFTQFTHPAVVPFVDVGTSGGLHYLSWPLAEGETLESRVQREGKLSAEQTARIGHQIAQGLNVSHQNGLFHGQVKPSNLMIGPDGQARILDFGIGSLLVENDSQESLVDTMSTSNTLMSGLDCASPESIMEPTNRTPAGDQYSLGCVLYYCLAGHVPFPEGTAVEKMTAHQLKQPKPIKEIVPGVPDALVAVIERLMQKSPDSRFTAMDEVVDALAPLVKDRASARPAASEPAAARPGPAPRPAQSTPPAGVLSPTPVPSVARSAPPPTASPRPAGGPVPGNSEASPRPSVPTRGTLGAPQPGPPRVPPPLPTQPVANASRRAAPPAAPAPAERAVAAPPWADEQPRRGALAPVLFVVVVGALIALTYFLGKNFLFPQDA